MIEVVPVSSNANTNLPARLTHFIGRSQELRLITTWLTPSASPAIPLDTLSKLDNPSSNPEIRIVTLTGAGGSGKTSLAIEVARRLLPYYPDGVWLVELAALLDPTRLSLLLSSTLGLVESSGYPAEAGLINYLRSRQILLILDNCEHLVEAVARLVAELSVVCPRLRVLATSREALNVEGEQQWRIPSLSLPPFQTVPPLLLAGLTQEYEALAFFVERARAVISSFELTEENASEVIRICQRLDGIPLALELAVARLKFLSLEQLAARLDKSFEVLTGGRRTALPRHQTLRATLEWSHSLLQPEEQVLFRRLAVFVSSFTLEAVEEVASDENLHPAQALELLGRLVDKSLVVVEYPAKTEVADKNNENNPPRYRFLEMVRQYALEKLATNGEMTECRQKHAAYYLAYAERIEPGLFSAAQQQLIKYQLWAEQANFRTALNWYQQQADFEAILRLAGSLWFFWLNGGLVGEGREWLEVGLSSLEAASLQPEPGLLAKALMAHGQLAWVQGQQTIAISEITRSIRLFEKSNDRKDWAFAVGMLGLIMLSNELTEAEIAYAHSCTTQSVATFRELNDRWCLANALLWLGNIAEAQRDYRQAYKAFEEAIELLSELKERLLLPLALSFLAQVLVRLGETSRAVSTIRESILLRRETGEKWYASMTVEILAGIVAEAGLFEQAVVLFGATESLRGAINASVLPNRQGSYAENIAKVQANLDKTKFEAALARGRKMDLEQLAEYVVVLEPELLLSPDNAGPITPEPKAANPTNQSSVSANVALAYRQLEPISQRELEILKLVALGSTSQEIANSLVITSGTVKWHLSNIYSKLDAKNRTQAVARARELGLLADLNL